MNKQTAARLRFFAIVALALALLVYLILRVVKPAEKTNEAAITAFVVTQTRGGEEIRRFYFHISELRWSERYALAYIPLENIEEWIMTENEDGEAAAEQIHDLRPEMGERLLAALEETNARGWEKDYFGGGSAMGDDVFQLTIYFAEGGPHRTDCQNAFPEGFGLVRDAIYSMLGLDILHGVRISID
ncbi:MAG: hypothetical protein FWF10_03600 [Clostridiales bacterium]|nr:hypothetical protein [Clostridiales bacterium]